MVLLQQHFTQRPCPSGGFNACVNIRPPFLRSGLIAALGAIGQIGTFMLPSGESVVVPVMELAGVGNAKGWRKLFRRRESKAHERVRALAIRTIGQIGQEEELEALEEYEQEADNAVRPAVREAIAALRSRLAS